MKLLTPDIQARLLENGRKQAPVRGTKDEIDFQPVVMGSNPSRLLHQRTNHVLV
jgi:hypothetical protein